jgi:iron complex outermembrane recepter protein
MKHYFRSFLARFALALAIVSTGFGQKPGTGVIEGRVFNAATGAAMLNARVVVTGTQYETTTDESGSYRLPGVPAGSTQVTVSFVGMENQAVNIVVPAGGVVRREFELVRSGGDSVVRLEALSVVADREMTAQAIAMNEQRSSPNLKNVVAFDEFGDRGLENIGEFLLFLPGVAVNVDGDSGPDSVSLRGMPGDQSGITLDGMSLAGARGNSRELDLNEVPQANLSRVEVTKVPTPDMSAAGLGGSINLITTGGFEHRRRTISYNLSTLFHNANGATLKWPRHHLEANSPKYTRPSFDFSYFQPVNDKFAFKLGGAYTWRIKPLDDSDKSRDETPTWNLVDLFQRTSNWSTRTQQYVTISGQAGFTWRITPNTTLSTDVYTKNYSMIVTRSNLDVNYGAGARGDRYHTQGATPGVGQVNSGNGTWYEHWSQTDQVNLNFRHRGDEWKFDAAGAWSGSNYELRHEANGHFTTVPTRISNLVIRGEDNSPDGMPRRITAANRAGAPVDVYDGGNYEILSASSTPQFAETFKTAGQFNVSRSFSGRFPLTLKTGVAVDRMERDRRQPSKNWNFAPNGNTTEAARLARNFDVFDEEYLATAKTVHGTPFRAISFSKMYELYRQHPDWFVLNEAQAHQQLVANSREFTETISATYLRADLRLLKNRLWLVGGVRFERTAVEGSGPLDDINAQYQRNANGDFIRTANGSRVLVTTDPLRQAQLRYREREAKASSRYSDFYPSLSGTYYVTDNLLVRAAYARTIGRPNVSFIIPGVTISEPDVQNPTITVTNPGLKPWVADNFDLSLESYNVKGGFGQIGVFQKNLSNFFGSVRTHVTPELLAFYGLPDDGSLDDYEFATRENIGDATIRGFEASYRQSLEFLPHWARGFQVFANYTKLSLSGGEEADFSEFNPEKYSGGLNFIRDRYAIKLTYSYQDETQRGLVAPSVANGIPANTYNYRKAYTRLSAYAQYSFSRRYSLYATIKDIGGLTIHELRYAPDTPDFARGARLQKLGYILTVGMKGTF